MNLPPDDRARWATRRIFGVPLIAWGIGLAAFVVLTVNIWARWP